MLLLLFYLFTRERKSDEARLLSHLLERYTELGPEIRPIKNSSKPVKVYLGLRLLHLDVDEKLQLFKTSAWLRMVSYIISIIICREPVKVQKILWRWVYIAVCQLPHGFVCECTKNMMSGLTGVHQ